MGCYCDLMGVNHEKWWFNEVNGSSSWKMGDFTWLKMTQKLCFFWGQGISPRLALKEIARISMAKGELRRASACALHFSHSMAAMVGVHSQYSSKARIVENLWMTRRCQKVIWNHLTFDLFGWCLCISWIFKPNAWDDTIAATACLDFINIYCDEHFILDNPKDISSYQLKFIN